MKRKELDNIITTEDKEKIGSGGSGTVYRVNVAFTNCPNRDVAVKIVPIIRN